MKLRRRLIFHFTFQFIAMAVLMGVVIFLTLLIVLTIYTKDVSEYNYYQAKLEDISLNTTNTIKTVQMKEDWDKEFQEENIWVQIINQDGKVIESGNVPRDVPQTYSYEELQQIKETKRLNNYAVVYFLDAYYETPYLFMLGYEDEATTLLNELVEKYNENGSIPEKHQAEIETILKNHGGRLEIYNDAHELQWSLGNLKVEKEKPLDVFVRELAPGTYQTNRVTYVDKQTGFTWALYLPNEKNKDINLKAYKALISGFVVTGAIILIITIGIAVWNGFRYGNPLFIFANWLGRMGNEHYAEVLTEEERKRIYKKNGKIRLRYRLYEDVFTAFYEMAEKLDASRKERERLEKTREEWMTGISHDLRTPLSTIQGYGNLLESGKYDWSKEELEEIGKSIREKSDYMLQLIEDFLLSFQLKNKVQVPLEEVSVNEFFQRLMRKYERDSVSTDYVLHFTPLQTEKMVKMNKRLFERMMDNLVYNAMKHNPPGTTISIVLIDQRSLEIIVKDNGVGMDEETMNHLFDRYYRGTNTDEKIEGTGLGMTIARQIAEFHNGTITVSSEKNVGTEVRITLK